MPAYDKYCEHASRQGRPREKRPLCLGFDTALQLLRELPSWRVANAERCTALPLAGPLEGDLHRVLRRLRQLVPSVALPLQVVTASRSRCRASARCRPHSCCQALPRQSLMRLDDDLLMACAPLVFVQEATSLSFCHLVELGYELCGTYRRGREDAPTIFQVEPLTSVAELSSFLRRAHGLNGAARAARALSYLADGSASPMETKAAVMFSLPVRLGGYGLGVPRMNHEVKASPEAASIAQRGSFRCDLCWPHARIDVEYQSRAYHEGEANRIRDSQRTNALMSMGYRVVGITSEELNSLSATEVIAGIIGDALGRRRRRQGEGARTRKFWLRKELGLRA